MGHPSVPLYISGRSKQRVDRPESLGCFVDVLVDPVDRGEGDAQSKGRIVPQLKVGDALDLIHADNNKPAIMAIDVDAFSPARYPWCCHTGIVARSRRESCVFRLKADG